MEAGWADAPRPVSSIQGALDSYINRRFEGAGSEKAGSHEQAADSSLEGNTGAFFSMIGVGDLVQQGIEDLVGSSVSMALARS